MVLTIKNRLSISFKVLVCLFGLSYFNAFEKTLIIHLNNEFEESCWMEKMKNKQSKNKRVS